MADNDKKSKKIAAFLNKFKTRIAAGALAATLLVPIVGSQVNDKHDKPTKPEDSDNRPGYEEIDPSYTPDNQEENTNTETKPSDTSPGNTETTDPSYTEPSSDETTPTNPTETTTKEEHEHHFTEWQTAGEQEKRTCLDDGHTEYRHHTLGIPSIKIESNNDGTYTEYTITKCTTCEYEITNTTIKKCEFGDWIYNPKTKLDERTCKISGYKETRNHQHNFILNTFDDNQEYYQCSTCQEMKSQNHKLDAGHQNKDNTITYNCTNPGCEYHLTKNLTPTQPSHHHTESQRVIFPTNPTADYCYEIETYCTSCQEVLSKSTHGHNLEETIDPNTLDKTIKCQEPNCNYTNTIKHTHKSSTKKEYPSGIQANICYEMVTYCSECGKELSRTPYNHNFKKTTDPQTHNVTYTCQDENCSYQYTVTHTHNRTTRTTYPNPAIASYCYEEIEYCSECGEVLSDTKHNHQMTTSTDPNTNDVTHSCTNPNCSYSYVDKHSHNLATRIDKPSTPTSSYCYEEVTYCTTCNKEISRKRINHTMTEKIDENTHDIIHNCQNCDYTYTDKHQHTIATKETSSNQNPNYCYETQQYCSECGENIGTPTQVPHNFTITEDAKHNKIYTCNKCGYSYTVEHHHQLDTREVILTNPTANECYTEETYCTDCLEVIESHTYGHQLENGDWGECTKCHNYEVQEPHVHTRKTEIVSRPDTPTDDYCYIAHDVCSTCGEVLKEDYEVPHDLEVLYESPVGTLYQCTNMGCNYMTQKMKNMDSQSEISGASISDAEEEIIEIQVEDKPYILSYTKNKRRYY